MFRDEHQRKCQLEEKENREYGFTVNGQEIIPLYDPPHLLKGIRNNMLAAKVKFTWKNKEQTASWEDVIKLYEVDVGDFDTKMCNRLTSCHIYSEKMNKMKVKLAAQVFSQRVSSTTRGLITYGACLPESAAGTADFLLFVDKVFDSVNGSSVIATHGKPLRCAVSDESPHMDFFIEALKVLATVRFIKNDGRAFIPPTIKNWSHTLRGFMYLWKNLKEKKLQYFCCRNVNQDPLENFFGCIRSRGIRNVNPTCTSFSNSYKSLLVNNFMAVHSPTANCESDDCDGALESLRKFILSPNSSDGEDTSPISVETVDVAEFSFTTYDERVIQTHNYIAGYIAKYIIKSVKGCAVCVSEIISLRNTTQHQFINIRAFTPDKLLRPGTSFVTLFGKCNDIMHSFLPQMCTENNVSRKLVCLIYRLVENDFTCEDHNLFSLFVKRFVNFYLLVWIKNVNNILRGLDNRNVNDSVKSLALLRYKKYKKK